MDPQDVAPDPCEVVPLCPVCKAGRMRLTIRTRTVVVCVCVHCEASLSVPHEALVRYVKDAR
jgi:hypothetical protein